MIAHDYAGTRWRDRPRSHVRRAALLRRGARGRTVGISAPRRRWSRVGPWTRRAPSSGLRVPAAH